MRPALTAVLLVFACGCKSTLDREPRWKSMTGVFSERFANKECLCTRGNDVALGTSSWDINCFEPGGGVAMLWVTWLDTFPGPNRSVFNDGFGAVWVPKADSQPLPTTRGTLIYEYSNLVKSKAHPEFLPMRRLFIDFANIPQDPVCQQQTGGACERASALEGFEIWCDDVTTGGEP